MSKYTKKEIESVIKHKKYKWFENGDFNVNIIAIRNSDTKNKITNLFDDLITLSYKENGQWKYHEWSCTTDAGASSMVKYSNPNGVAILVPNQYLGTHEIRKHKNQYHALCQRYNKKLKVYRDNNKDLVYDYGKIFDDASGINVHSAGNESIRVDGWSEGCLVFKRKRDFNEFMSICKKSKDLYSNSFTLTLIESKDIK